MVDAISRFPLCGTFLHFTDQFLLRNTPCLFGETVTSSWKARSLWQVEGKPNFDYLLQQFGMHTNIISTVHFTFPKRYTIVPTIFLGGLTVPVADCTSIKFSAHEKSNWTFANYINYFRNERPNSAQTTDSPPSPAASVTVPFKMEQATKLLYLKDWHFVR